MSWGVKIQGDSNNNGSSFIINAAKNSYGSIHITVEVNDGQTTVSQGFHCHNCSKTSFGSLSIR